MLSYHLKLPFLFSPFPSFHLVCYRVAGLVTNLPFPRCVFTVKLHLPLRIPATFVISEVKFAPAKIIRDPDFKAWIAGWELIVILFLSDMINIAPVCGSCSK